MEIEERKNQVAGVTFERFLKVDRAAINVEARTVELAFSSEAPVDRFYGQEILDHKQGSCRLGRLLDAAPVLINHDPDEQVGVVEAANIGADRVGRAVVRFGKGECADEVFQDIVDGIRTKVSVGYIVHDMVLDKKLGDEEVYRVTDWEPLEISIVAIPADNSVGVGRSKTTQITKETKMTEEVKQEATKAAPAVDVVAERAAAVKAEQQRARDLTAAGKAFASFGGSELAERGVAEGWSVDQLNAELLKRVGTKKATPSGDIGMSEKEIKNYSFARALHALANPRDARAQEAAAYEREVSEAAATRAGKPSQGLMVPADVLHASVKRDMTVGTATAGGHTVATNLLAGSFIELLRNKLIIGQMGATVMNGLVGNVAIPRQTSATTAYWVAESASPTESALAVDQVTMSPKTVGAFVDYSRKLLIQSSLDVEGLIRNDHAAVLARELDRVALYGSGSSNQPLGIKGASGVGTVNFAADTPTFAELVSMETAVAVANADVGNLSYLTSATQRGALKVQPKIGSTYPVFALENGQINGYNCAVSNVVTVGSSTGHDIFFGNWADLMLGFWSGLDLMVDPYAGSTAGTVRVIALQDTDVAVRHGESFVRGNNNL